MEGSKQPEEEYNRMQMGYDLEDYIADLVGHDENCEKAIEQVRLALIDRILLLSDQYTFNDLMHSWRSIYDLIGLLAEVSTLK